MGKKLQNKTKIRRVKHDLSNQPFSLVPETSNSEWDAIEEKTANDLISNLSDDLLQHIISFLPSRDAVRTSFLSTRWRGLWKRGLETTQKDSTVDDICREIGQFLNDAQKRGVSTWGQKFSSHLSLLKHSMRLQLNFGHSSFLLATIMPNGTLHLDFYTKKDESPIDFDWHLITDYYYISWPWWYITDDPYFLTVSPFMSIRTLHLIAVTNLTSEAVSSILPKFKFLESLIIKECHGLHSLSIDVHYYFSHLMIFNCPQLKTLHIKHGKIIKFRFRGLLPRFTYESFRYSNPLGLVDAMLDFRRGPGYEHFTSNSFLSAIRSVRILTLCRWTFEAGMGPWPRPSTFKFYCLEELQWIDNVVDKHSIDSLISFLKKCPFLKKLYINIDPTTYTSPRAKYLTQASGCKRLDFLEVVQLEGVAKECDMMLLANRLLNVATKKTKIIAKSYDNRIWKLEVVSLSQLWQLCRARMWALCRGPKIESPLMQHGMKYYTFVEVNEEEESSKLYSKHSHADL